MLEKNANFDLQPWLTQHYLVRILGDLLTMVSGDQYLALMRYNQLLLVA